MDVKNTSNVRKCTLDKINIDIKMKFFRESQKTAVSKDDLPITFFRDYQATFPKLTRIAELVLNASTFSSNIEKCKCESQDLLMKKI